jgi:hypothetical protein
MQELIKKSANRNALNRDNNGERYLEAEFSEGNLPRGIFLEGNVQRGIFVKENFVRYIHICNSYLYVIGRYLYAVQGSDV